MSLQQYNSLISNLLKEKHSLAKLREELKERKGRRESYVSVVKGLGTWPVTAGTRGKERRRQLFSKISSKC